MAVLFIGHDFSLWCCIRNDLSLKKPSHIYRWRTSWKQRRAITRPTEDRAFRKIGGLDYEVLPPSPIRATAERLGHVLLVALLQGAGLEGLHTTDDILAGVRDFDPKEAYMIIAEHLDKKGRVTYWNEQQKQYQKTVQPLMVADTLNKLLPFQVTPGEVRRAQKYKLAMNDEDDDIGKK